MHRIIGYFFLYLEDSCKSTNLGPTHQVGMQQHPHQQVHSAYPRHSGVYAAIWTRGGTALNQKFGLNCWGSHGFSRFWRHLTQIKLIVLETCRCISFHFSSYGCSSDLYSGVSTETSGHPIFWCPSSVWISSWGNEHNQLINESERLMGKRATSERTQGLTPSSSSCISHVTTW